ncbi:unnamed protein product [Pleuronectes platessa]|uniref:Uncharacterized protein n=1 Tax=Pleuronectes platessa TaxID=8262 RepID=A0A9N7Z8R8_PLEPL|nr:unnamed protein product [Pleuronectes platessa]
MEEVREDGGAAERRGDLQRSNPPPVDAQPHPTSRSQFETTLRPWRSYWYFAPVGVVWLVCQVEAQADVCWRLLLLGFLWTVLGGCVQALRWRLQPGHDQGEPAQREQPEEVTENRNIQCSWASPSRSPGLHVPLALALVNSLLLCVLQEPLPDPSVPHIQALLSRLQSVSLALEEADPGSDVTLDEVDGGSTLKHTVKLLCTYLQQRMRSLRTLVQVQGDFEAGVKYMLEGLDGLWAQLEELHTGVTLTKEGGEDQGDVALARTRTENLFSVLSHYRSRLQSCQTHLRDGTRQLQELMWSHTHISHKVSSSSESLWPELLLQANIEQFDKVQESFFSLDQQTSTFTAHLEGLRKANEEGHARPLACANGAGSRAASPQASPRLGHTSDSSPEPCSTSVSSMETDLEDDAPLSLCERSALQFSSTIGRLRKSGKRN